MVLTFLKCFCQNINTFYTKHFCLPTFVPTYYFSCVTLACIIFFPKISLFTFPIHLELINYFPSETFVRILFFPKISLFIFLIHLELINYLPCVILACILLSLQIDAQSLHIDEKLSTSSTSIWLMMMLFGSTDKSHHCTVGACSRLRRRHGESEKLITF